MGRVFLIQGAECKTIPSITLFKRVIGVPLQHFPKATEKIKWVFVGGVFPIQGAEQV